IVRTTSRGLKAAESLVRTSGDSPAFSGSDHALAQHRLRHPHEAGHTGALDIIRALALATIFQALMVDARHDVVQTPIHFFTAPGMTQAVLTHLQTAYRHTAGVGGLAGSVTDTVAH